MPTKNSNNLISPRRGIFADVPAEYIRDLRSWIESPEAKLEYQRIYQKYARRSLFKKKM